jgi:hypothetical protein
MSQNHERRLRLVCDVTGNAASSDDAQRASSAESAEAVIMRVSMTFDEGLLPDDAA